MVPKISSKAFWDTDMNSLDFDRQKKAIIERIFNDGAWDDILTIINYYGDETVKEALVTAAYLKKSAVLLSAKIFKIDPRQFKCYTKLQSQKTL